MKKILIIGAILGIGYYVVNKNNETAEVAELEPIVPLPIVTLPIAPLSTDEITRSNFLQSIKKAREIRGNNTPVEPLNRLATWELSWVLETTNDRPVTPQYLAMLAKYGL